MSIADSTADSVKSNLDYVLDKLHTLKRSRAVTYRALAADTGVSVTTTHSLHHGGGDLSSLIAVANYYDCGVAIDGVTSTTSVGRRLKDIRNARGLPLSRIARLTGVSDPTLTRVESGNDRVRVSTLCRVADALCIRLTLLPSKLTAAKHDLDAWKTARVVPDDLWIADDIIGELLQARIDRLESRISV